MLKAAMDRGEPIDASLAALRQQGASIIDSIKAVREANLASSLLEAKRLVEASSAWEGGREARGQFVDEITKPHGAFSQTAGNGQLTIRDLLWLMVVVALAVAWTLERGKSSRMNREREEAIAKWHVASQGWVEATKMIPPQRSNCGGMGGGGMGGAKGKVLPVLADEDSP